MSDIDKHLALGLLVRAGRVINAVRGLRADAKAHSTTEWRAALKRLEDAERALQKAATSFQDLAR